MLTFRLLHCLAFRDRAQVFRSASLSASTLLARLEPWNSGRRYLNFTESQADPRTIFPEASWKRLQQLKSIHDPNEMFLANHCIPVADPTG